MQLTEAKQAVEGVVTLWHEKLPDDARIVIQLDNKQFTPASKHIKSLVDKLKSELLESDGVDEHKEAAALGVAVSKYYKALFKFNDDSSPYATEIWQRTCWIECPLYAFLSFLAVDISAIEAKTIESLRDLFDRLHKENPSGEKEVTIALFLSTMGYFMERVYPE